MKSINAEELVKWFEALIQERKRGGRIDYALITMEDVKDAIIDCEEEHEDHPNFRGED